MCDNICDVCKIFDEEYVFQCEVCNNHICLLCLSYDINNKGKDVFDIFFCPICKG